MFLIFGGTIIAIMLLWMAWHDTVSFCNHECIGMKMLLAFTAIAQIMSACIIIRNFVISPLVAEGIISGELKYADVVQSEGWYINMNIIDEILEE